MCLATLCFTDLTTTHARRSDPREAEHAMNTGYALGGAETRGLLTEACAAASRE
jgi:hypothetical protein